MKKTRRTPSHHVFEECAKLTTDPFWKDVLTKCSYNKFPSGFMYKEGCLTHRRGKRISKIYLPSTPEEALETTTLFFREKDHICSDQDRDKEEEYLAENVLPLPPIEDWSQLKKKKKLLEVVLNEYIRGVIKNNGLGAGEKDQLTTILNIALIQGYFNDETVSVSENRISEIKGLVYDPQSRLFSLPVSEKKIKVTKSTSRRSEPSSGKQKLVVNFYSLWAEFLKSCGEAKN